MGLSVCSHEFGPWRLWIVNPYVVRWCKLCRSAAEIKPNASLWGRS